MNAETVRMSSKGQVVIPQSVREMIHADEGTLFSVMSADDAVILKKIETPSKEDLIKRMKEISKKMTKELKAKGFKEEDLWKAVERERARHRPKP